MKATDAGDYVGRCHSLAALLEVSAYPKPGNIHRTRDNEDTNYEHFLASSVATTPAIRDLAARAHELSKNKDYRKLQIGSYVLHAAEEMMIWQKGGNVQLGIILLHAPLAAAAGASYKNPEIDPILLRKNLIDIIDDAQPIDSLNIYKAINHFMPRRVLGEAEEMDVTDNHSLNRIIEEKIKPKEIFMLCRDRDQICNEWVTGFETTFTKGYPYLRKKVLELVKINQAVLQTFLYLLSRHPDSLIARKRGKEAAEIVSEKARNLLKKADEPSFMNELHRLDEELWVQKGSLNPGTTADITSASIFVLLLEGWRP